MAKSWTKTELAHLGRNAASMSIEGLAEEFNTDADNVRSKIADLGLDSKESTSADEVVAIADYTRGIELLNKQEWAKAAEVFEKIATSSDAIHLADRARQSLAICVERIGDHSTGDGDHYVRAVVEKNHGNLEQALEICRQHGNPEEEPFAYLMASIQALGGAEDEALELLANAIREEPKNRVHAYHDSDFQSLHGSEEFSQLVQSPR